jgi:hypothetical protein
MVFDFSNPHTFYVIAAYGFFALFVTGFGVHALLRLRGKKNGSPEAPRDRQENRP